MSRLKVGLLAFSAAGLVALVGYESYTSTAVIPVKGDKPTIGFGTTEGVSLGDRITPPEALARAARDVAQAEGAVKRCANVPLHPWEYDAYTSLAYNIGITAFCSSTLVKKLKAGDYAGACAEISRWNKFKGKELRGLTIRRASERKLCERKP